MLLIGTTGTETRFLSEAELPECARLAYGAEGREDVRPDELADRELAEALQRSIQESGKRPSARLWGALSPPNLMENRICMSNLQLLSLHLICAFMYIVSF